MEDTSPSEAAAIIYRERVLSEIGEENAKLEAENARLQPMREYLQTVEICLGNQFGDLSETKRPQGRILYGPREILFDWASTSQTIVTKLESGKVVKSEDGFDVEIPIDGISQPLANFGYAGGISVEMAGRDFREHFTNAYLEFKDGSQDAKLELFPCHGVCIKGKLEGLSKGDYARLKQPGRYHCGNITSFLIMANAQEGVLDSPDATFTPQSICFSDPSLQESFQVLGILTEETVQESNVAKLDADLRHLTISALGEKSHVRLLNDNKILKSINENLQNIKTFVTSIEVETVNGRFRFPLEGGVRNSDTWAIDVSGSEFSTVPLIGIRDIKIYMMGVDIKKDMTYAFPHLSHYPNELINDDEGRPKGLIMSYGSKALLKGFYDWSGYSQDEIEDLVEDFETKMVRVLHPEIRLDDNAPKFPPTFKIRWVCIGLDLSECRSILEMAGISYEPFMKEQDSKE